MGAPSAQTLRKSKILEALAAMSSKLAQGLFEALGKECCSPAEELRPR